MANQTTINGVARFIPRHDTSANWTTHNPILLNGEYGFNDSHTSSNDWVKKGDGVHTWSELSFIQINDLSEIEALIPQQASAQNQLADKAFVNSSVGTNTAYYISNNGQPFNSLAELQAYSGTVTNNDYAFVKGTDGSGNTTYSRYKYSSANNAWSLEYILNNSSFTAAQWSAISSGITSGKVAEIDAKYVKPSGGIPKTDLASDVQTSLGKADSALQSHQDISGKQDKFMTKSQPDNLWIIENNIVIDNNAGKSINFIGAILKDGVQIANITDIDNRHDNSKLDTSKVKTQNSATEGDVYDVTYINSQIGDIETLLQALRGTL